MRRRDGRWHSVVFVPMAGAVGIAAVERLAAKAAAGQEDAVVLAASLGPAVRAALVENGLGFLDLAGNCHLELADGDFTVHVEGRRRAPRPSGQGTLRAAGYRVLFALLAAPRLLDGTVRDVGRAANVSRHAVQSLLARLRDEGLLSRSGRSTHVFLPGGAEQAIDRFTIGWADVLRGSLLLGRFRVREPDPQQAAEAVARGLRAAEVPFGFGGAIGAARWSRFLQSEELTVHVASWGPDLVRRLGLVPDRQGPLHVFRTMTTLDLESGEPETVHPLLIHAELARSPQPRSREAATLLLERILQDAD